jgi:hypothetical protein
MANTEHETNVAAFILNEVRCFNRGESTSEHVQERMDWYFGTRYHQEIWSRLLESIGIDNWMVMIRWKLKISFSPKAQSL